MVSNLTKVKCLRLSNWQPRSTLVMEHQCKSCTHKTKGPSLLDVTCQKSPVEITAYCVIDKSFLNFGLPPSLILEDNIIIPPSFYLCKSPQSSKKSIKTLLNHSVVPTQWTRPPESQVALWHAADCHAWPLPAMLAALISHLLLPFLLLPALSLSWCEQALAATPFRHPAA